VPDHLQLLGGHVRAVIGAPLPCQTGRNRLVTIVMLLLSCNFVKRAWGSAELALL
jgi:hypothetical protein